MLDDFLQNGKVNALNGDVQAQNIKVDINEWLNLGCEGYNALDDKLKAAAYQAALAVGWTDEAIKAIMVEEFSHLTDFMVNFTIEELHRLAKDHSFEVEEVRQTDTDFTIKDKSKD